MKAWRAKAFENHPDRGGDPIKMVEVNVAKDVLLGKQLPTTEHPKPPEQETSGKSLFDEHSFKDAATKARAPLSSVYWMWVTEYRNFEPESFEARRLGALDTGWVAYGRHDDGDHVFLPVGSGMFSQSSPDEHETWWVGTAVKVSRKVPAAKAVELGRTKATNQIKGLSKTNSIYTISGLGRRYLDQKDLENPKGSPTTVKKWLEDTGWDRQVPFKLVIKLEKGPLGDRLVAIKVNGHSNTLSPQATEEFRRDLAHKIFKKNQTLWWDASLDLTRMQNPGWTMRLLWDKFRHELSAQDTEAFKTYLRQIGILP
jgi:hypothetical protein